MYCRVNLYDSMRDEHRQLLGVFLSLKSKLLLFDGDHLRLQGEPLLNPCRPLRLWKKPL
jgi:hypothetical protein